MRFTKFSSQVIFILCAGLTLFHSQIWLFGKCGVNNVCVYKWLDECMFLLYSILFVKSLNL